MKGNYFLRLEGKQEGLFLKEREEEESEGRRERISRAPINNILFSNHKAIFGKQIQTNCVIFPVSQQSCLLREVS